MVPVRSFHGVETVVSRSSGLRVFRVEHPPGQRIEDHAHDWPCLTLYRCGSYFEQGEGLSINISGPAAVYHPAGRAHSNEVGPHGLDTVSIIFDPAALGLRTAYPMTQGGHWIGGTVGRLASSSAIELTSGDADGVGIIAAFFDAVSLASPTGVAPPWLDRLEIAISAGITSTGNLAAVVGRHPAWVARAYLHATGESIEASIRRRRAERALLLVRSTDRGFAAIAADAGFCDQSHMVRTFRRLLGRTPSEIRAASSVRPPE